ncbi:hypothetical protein P8625_13640 [Tenacibaculum tangerinum]|uniref:Lipocalin-like domain-containing protein n=1 Tax=Tenacibaculum tangerinum TaxID=3038772 RepID=A0ABY8L0V8_9FLAO|nr:hypothetical protein [Tenacibaculum tangerinum]WGH75101.1 hypothetical protein P8625_13640 [Tenacibaculum tangerinum]
MKKIRTILKIAIVLIVSITLQSCSSNDESDVQNPETYIRFTINDTNYEFKDIITAESTSITLNGNNGEGFSNAGDTQIALWLPLALSNGTFEVEGGFSADYQIAFTSNSLAFDFDFANSGTITVTKSTGEYIEGTFSASITNDDDVTITLTNGAFKAFGIE